MTSISVQVLPETAFEIISDLGCAENHLGTHRPPAPSVEPWTPNPDQNPAAGFAAAGPSSASTGAAAAAPVGLAASTSASEPDSSGSTTDLSLFVVVARIVSSAALRSETPSHEIGIALVNVEPLRVS